jgi:hypothetical protein
MENKYHSSKIYKIVNINEPDKFYIGSTYDKLCKRFQQHITDSQNEKRKAYKTFWMVELRRIGKENFKIILVEDYKCENREQLHQRENYWITKLNSYYNTNKAFRTNNEIKQYTQEYMKEYRRTEKGKKTGKRYYENNKQKISEYWKQKVFCIYCKREMTRYGWKYHSKSQRHEKNYNKHILEYKNQFEIK